MNKDDIIRFLDPFTSEMELFILIDGYRVPIKTLTYEVSSGTTGRAILEPEHIIKPDIVREGDERFFLWADGACSGNPGPGGWAYFLSAFSVINKKYDGLCTYKRTGYHKGSTTNNAMELEAVTRGLKAAYSMPGKKSTKRAITITSNSEYVIKGITGQYAVKTNLPAWHDLKGVLANMDEWEIEWVRLSPLNACHRWCDQAAKAAAKNKGDIGVLLANAVVGAPTVK